MIFQAIGLLITIWVVFIIIAIILVIWLLSGIRVVVEYERLVIFRLGRFKRIIGPGVVFVLPGLEKSTKVDLRIMTIDIPRQEVISRDNIPVIVNAVVYFRVIKADVAIITVRNYVFAVQQYTQAALRDIIGSRELDSILTEREEVAADIKEIVDSEINQWGIDVKSVKIQEIELPKEMKRAMAAQAEAEREKRAAIIGAEGELEAAKNLQKAAALLAQEPGALHLRTLHTIRDISQDPSQKIVIFLPSSIENFLKKL